MSPLTKISYNNLNMIREVKDKLNSLSTYTPEVLTLEDRFGEYNSFKLLLPEFVIINKIVEELKEFDLGFIPYHSLIKLRDLVQKILTHFQEITIYSPGVQHADAEYDIRREQIINKTHELLFEFSNLYSLIKPSYELSTLENKYKSREKELQNVIRGYEEKFKETLEKATISGEKVEEIRESTFDASKKIGVNKYGDIFKKQSYWNNASSFLWLIATLIVLGIIFKFGVELIDVLHDISNAKSEDSTLYTDFNIQFTLVKVSIIASLLYLLTICRSNYKAQKHNSVINNHRHNALTTFKTFTDATEDEFTKNTVLIEATKVIFSHQNSGYLKEEKESNESNKIIEIIRNHK